MTTTAITKEQIENLIVNAYGFVDSYGVMYHGHESLFHDEYFEIQDVNGEYLQLTYDNALLDLSGIVSFELYGSEGKMEQLTVIMVADNNNLKSLL